QVLVNLDPVWVYFNADRLEADAFDARPPTGRHEQPVAPQFATVEAQDILVTLPPRGGGVHPEHQLDSVRAKGLSERLAQRRRLTGEHAARTLDNDRLAAEATHDLRDLDARGPATQHEQATRHSLHARRLASAPDTRELTQA